MLADALITLISLFGGWLYMQFVTRDCKFPNCQTCKNACYFVGALIGIIVGITIGMDVGSR